MERLQHWLDRIMHNYVLIAAAALIYFLIKAAIGYAVYRQSKRRLARIEQKIDKLYNDQNR
ncbi:hypothetical protein [Paenibacillus jiagnxiensis]|uniref:hypothetical protein n=1 Tax=Paenibacillus jiagnxiensis TaxID=3228926 RepID=UPI00349829DB